MINGSNSIFRNIPPVVLNLLILNALIWLFMALVPIADTVLTRNLSLYYFSSPGFRPFQLVTYMFLHGGFSHLFFNMFALFIFGSTIERVMGSARFLFYYLTCGICAALVQMGAFAIAIHDIESTIGDPAICNEFIQRGWEAFRLYGSSIAWPAYPDLSLLNSYVNSPLVGASGAIYGILLAFGFLFPNAPVYIFFIPVPIKAKWLIIGYFVIELASGLGGVADNVAHFAHLGGMVFGLLLLIYWKKKGVFTNRWFF